MALRSTVKLANSRTGSSSRSGGTARSRCTADVDAGGVGVGDRQRRSGLARLQADASIALGHGLLHHSLRNVALHRVRRLAHSLKRNIDPAAAYRQADSPMSMTSPRTTLTRGQYAPLLHRSSAAPHSTLPEPAHAVFLRRDLRQRADYFANPSLQPTCYDLHWSAQPSQTQSQWRSSTEALALRMSAPAPTAAGVSAWCPSYADSKGRNGRERREAGGLTGRW